MADSPAASDRTQPNGSAQENAPGDSGGTPQGTPRDTPRGTPRGTPSANQGASLNSGRSSSPQLAASSPMMAASSPLGTPRSPLGTPLSPASPGAYSPGHGTPSMFRRSDLSGSLSDRRRSRRRTANAGRPHRSRSSTPYGTPARSPGGPDMDQAAGEAEAAGAAANGIPEGQAGGGGGGGGQRMDEDMGETYVWGTSVSVEDVTQKFTAFMRGFREAEEDMEAKYSALLNEVIEREGDTLNIDSNDVWQFNPELYKLLVRYPLEVIPIVDIVVADMAVERVPEWNRHIQVRTFNLKKTVNMRDLNPADIDQLVAIKGMAIRCSSVIPDIKAAFFRCLVCGFSPPPVFVDRGRVEEPGRCQRQECGARNSMTLVHNRCSFINKQLVRLQETPEAIPEGETPHTVTVCMFDSLVDFARPGDRVEVTGVFRAAPVRVTSNQRTLRSLYKTYLDCVHVRKEEKGKPNTGAGANAADVSGAQANSDDMFYLPPEQVEKLRALAAEPDIYDRLTRSLAPSIFELDDVKKGLLCQLFGGSVKKLASGAQFRGDNNILIVGDPGTSKSQLLQYVHKIAPRGIYTSGRGSSAVGLTAYVTKDPETGEMVLESGALVLSDRGICCIDEFDKMSESARSMLHEVMEQQTVSVAKAGIIATLNARTSVLACANPIGSRYNPRLSVIDNIHLPPTLLSRFDLIYLVLDKADEVMDRRLARHLVGLHYDNPEERESGSVIDLSTLASFISYARHMVHPQLSDSAAEDLVNAYVDLRSRGMGRKVITATPRQLESLIRLSEALARMRFSETVESSDVAEARRLLHVAMQQSATDPNTGTIDMDLITTGVSASERNKRTQIQDALMTMLQSRISASRSSLRAMQMWEELKQQSSMPVSLQEVREALQRLQGEGRILFSDDVVRLP